MTIKLLTKLPSFNPRVLAGGRDIFTDMTFFPFLFQSTRPRGRTRHVDNYKRCNHSVSIHASSREDATILPESFFTSMQFQSTRPRGRTRPVSGFQIHRPVSFNPRVLAGGRDSKLYKEENAY